MGQPFTNMGGRGWPSYEFPVVHDTNADTGELGELLFAVDFYQSHYILIGNVLDSEIGVIFNSSFQAMTIHTESLYEAAVTVTHDGPLTASAKQVYLKPIADHYGSQPKSSRMGILVCDNGGNGPVFVDVGNDQNIIVNDDPNAADYYPVGVDASSGELISAELTFGDIFIGTDEGNFFEVSNSGGSQYTLYVETSGGNADAFVMNNTGTGTDLTFTLGGSSIAQRVTKLLSAALSLYIDDSEEPGENLYHRDTQNPSDLFVKTIMGDERYLKVKYDATGAKGSKIYLHAGTPIGYEMKANLSGAADTTIKTDSTRLPYSF